MSVDGVYETVNVAWTERRLENALERQKELAALHLNIKANSTALIGAICHDLSTTQASATEEIAYVLDAVKSLYDDLDFPSALKKEKSIKRGGNVEKNLTALGPTLIESSAECPISSTLIPLAAAVAAGSGAVVLPSALTTETNKKLRNLIFDSFDREAVGVALDCSPEARLQLSSKYFGVAVLQDMQYKEEMKQALRKTNSCVHVLEPSFGIPAVFVDRSTKDLEAVAAHLSTLIDGRARVNAFRTPRLCLIDEFVAERLVELMQRSQYGRASVSSAEPSWSSDFKRTFEASFPTTLKQNSRVASSPIIVLNNSDPITAENVRAVARSITLAGKQILFVPTRSVDHGIDVLNQVNGKDTAPAVYIFAEGKTAFYFGSFTNAHHVMVNDIPLRSSVMISPATAGNTYELPFTAEDFSVNKPVVQSVLSTPGRIIGSSETFVSRRLQMSKIYQPSGAGRMSFFEQGLILGVAVLLTSTCTALYFSYRGARLYFKNH